ncbi:hypothetical protein [Streptomyces sp. H39-S7]|uniref:hypothetical protein n=1 Tax=Streptomyces sp. H39-S7 TaxID=3004357 RepID=UPI0022AF704E|nr:hypothetical protein [Streptomyces sp. H39-S7]MCZ4123788.1 hypothetical protein [Streptomyces sp. H39-S7]
MRRGNDMTRYRYWSERQIRALERDNGLRLGRSWRIATAGTPGSMFGIPLPALGFQRSEVRERSRRQVADRVTAALREQTAVTYDEEYPVLFARGLGKVAFSAFTDGPARDKGVVLHTRIQSNSGQRVDLCLFGSLDNAADFRPGEALEGSSSSAWYAVAELLESRGQRNTSQWDDQGLAVEALEIALGDRERGEDGTSGDPWTRRWTLGHAIDVEWLAVIYSDVTLDRGRWRFDGGSALVGTQRIIVGAPVWVRAPGPRSVVRYADLRRAAASSPTGWRRLVSG